MEAITHTGGSDAGMRPVCTRLPHRASRALRRYHGRLCASPRQPPDMTDHEAPTGFPRNDVEALPLHLVRRDTLAAWRARQPATTGAWLDAHAFDASPGTMLPLPAADGGIAGSLLGIGD